jgi:hypothetical protein
VPLSLNLKPKKMANENPKPALNWPTTIEGQFQRAREIRDKVTAGTTGIVVLPLNTAITNAQTAEDNVGLGVPGGVSIRKGKISIMKHECEKIMDLVYEATEGLTVEAAIALMEENGFHPKGHAIINKEQFEARNGDVSGSVDLITKAPDEDAAHEWAYTLDDEVTWIYITTTLQAKTTVTGLIKASQPRFRHRNILRSGPTDWEYFDLVIL